MTQVGLRLADVLDGSELPHFMATIVARRASDAGLLQRFARLTPQELFAPALQSIGATDVSRHIVEWWVKHREIQKALDASRRDAGHTQWLELASHTATLSLGPSVDVWIQGTESPILRVDLEIQLAITLEAALLEVRAGSVVSVRPGKISGIAHIDLQGVRVGSTPRRTLEFPGKWDMMPGPLPLR